MRRDRCLVTTLSLLFAVLVIGHHVHEHMPQLFLTLAPDREQEQLRTSVFDDLEGYGSNEENNASQQLIEVKRAHEHELQSLRDSIALRNAQLERLTGELDTLQTERTKQTEQLARINDVTAPRAASVPSAEPPAASCDDASIFVGEDIAGSDISSSAAPHAQGCCQQCARHQRAGGSCVGWTFAEGSERCYLKSTVSPVSDFKIAHLSRGPAC